MQQSRLVFCLLVESRPSVGLSVAEVLDATGHFVAGPFPSQAQARRWLERFTPDLAILDPALQCEQASPIVLALETRGIPFVFHSATEPDHTTISRLEEAYGVESLSTAILMREAWTARPDRSQGRKCDHALCCDAAKPVLSRPNKQPRAEIAHARASAA